MHLCMQPHVKRAHANNKDQDTRLTTNNATTNRASNNKTEKRTKQITAALGLRMKAQCGSIFLAALRGITVLIAKTHVEPHAQGNGMREACADSEGTAWHNDD